MKPWVIGAGALLLAGCTVHIDHDPKTGDLKAFYVTPSLMNGVQGNGVAKTDTRSLAPFKAVDADSAVDVEIHLGAVQSVRVLGDENLLPLIETRLDGDTLRIRETKGVSSRNPLKVVLTMPALDKVAQSGAGDLLVDGLDADAFTFSSDGPGDAHLSGKVAHLTLNSGGAGDVLLSKLQADDLKLTMSGPGDLHLQGMLKRLDAHVTGAGGLVVDQLEGPATLDLNGPGDVSLSGPVTEVSANVNGSGGLRIVDLAGGNVALQGNGPGDIQLGGHIGKLKLAMTGSGDLRADGLSASDVDAVLSGPGDVQLGDIDAEHFHANLSGSGSLRARGKARELDVSVAGPGDADLGRLSADEATVQSSGSGDVRAQVNGKLRAQSSGPGEVVISGHPMVQDIHGRNISIAD
jgi:hypothetical protein